MSKKVKESKLHDVHVVGEEFLKDLSSSDTNKDIEQLITKNNIGSWGSDLKARIKLSIESNEKVTTEKVEAKFANKSIGDGKVKMKVKGGAAVDPDSGLEDEGHVLLEAKTGEPYTCVLGLVDIIKGTNSFYKLQIIELDIRST